MDEVMRYWSGSGDQLGQVCRLLTAQGPGSVGIACAALAAILLVLIALGFGPRRRWLAPAEAVLTADPMRRRRAWGRAPQAYEAHWHPQHEQHEWCRHTAVSVAQGNQAEYDSTSGLLSIWRLWWHLRRADPAPALEAQQAAIAEQISRLSAAGEIPDGAVTVKAHQSS